MRIDRRGMVGAGLLACALVASCAGAAKPPKNQDGGREGKPMKEKSAAEVVMKDYELAGPPASAPGFAIEGVTLFWLQLPSRGADNDRGTGVAVVGGASSSLAGTDAMRAVVERLAALHKNDDALLLARTSALLLGVNGHVLTKPDTEVPGTEHPRQIALVRPPSLQGDVVEYWTYESPIEHPALTRWRFNRATLAIERTPAGKLVGK